MTSDLKLILGTINNQPIGAYDYLVEKDYQQSYKPFLTVLYNFPKIDFTMYYSGHLLYWLDSNHSEFNTVLNEMISNRQVEILGNGFYEPVFPMIPLSDRIGQIEMMTTYIRKTFGKRTRGCLIPGNIWDPSLASILKSCSMEYTFLDESYFLACNQQNLFAPVMTEDQGKNLVVIPINTHIVNSIPDIDPREIIDYLALVAEKYTDPVVTILIQGTSMGSQNSSYDKCYNEKWLESFLQLLMDNKSWLETTTPNRLIKKREKPYTKGYFSTLTNGVQDPKKYYSLNAETLQSLQSPERNGKKLHTHIGNDSYRNSVLKYRESNHLHCKMMYTYLQVKQIRGDKYRKKAAQEELWKGQANFSYWHTANNGIYAKNFRFENYRALIEAEKITREKGIFAPGIINTDFDMDGINEYLYQGTNINAYVDRKGGIMTEFDYLPKSLNYLDTMARYDEPYNQGEDLPVDTYARKSYVDHVFSSQPDIRKLESNTMEEACDYIHGLFNVQKLDRDHMKLHLSKSGTVQLQNQASDINVQKQFAFNEDSVDVTYIITNESEAQLSFYYAPELNFSLASNSIESQRVFSVEKHSRREIIGESRAVNDKDEIEIIDVTQDVTINLKSTVQAVVYIFPVKTKSKSRLYGINEMYQSTCTVFCWKIQLPPGGSFTSNLAIKITQKS